MPSDNKSLDDLQQALSMELTAIHQYLLHAHVLEDWGLDKLAAKMREEMQEELGHAGAFIERMLFLHGDPEVAAAHTPKRAQTLKDMFESDLREEKNAIAFYSKASMAAFERGDLGTRALFERIALDEEGHQAWLELQLDLLERMGEPAYVSKNMSGPSSDAGDD
ncbi:MAG: bacterioferritin [Pseudomonadota bacterium]